MNAQLQTTLTILVAALCATAAALLSTTQPQLAIALGGAASTLFAWVGIKRPVDK